LIIDPEAMGDVGWDEDSGNLDHGFSYCVLLSGARGEAVDLLGTMCDIECERVVLALMLGDETSDGIIDVAIVVAAVESDDVEAETVVLTSVGAGTLGTSDFPGTI
jgi:hypothetical protein